MSRLSGFSHVQSFDAASGHRARWVALAREHHRQQRALLEAMGHTLQVVVRNGREPIQGVVSKQRHGHLAFRITKTDVEFHHVGVALLVDHQPDIEHTTVGHVLCGEVRMHRSDDLRLHFGLDLRGHDRGWTVCTHATRVWTGIALTHALVVLTCGQASVTGGIHQHQHAGFFPGEEGLDDHGTRGGDGAEGEGLRLVPVLSDEHAFATGKPVLLDDPWCTRKAVEGLAKGSCPSDDDVLSRRYTSGLHGLFGKGLGAFKRRMRSHRTETRSSPKRVSKAIAQGRLWTDDHEMHVEFIRQREETRDVCSAHRMVRAEV